jgi:microcystin-dependent protein
VSDPFVAEIRIFPFFFAPRGWAFCNGQLLPISQNTALFSLVGTFYGGDGKSTFALPNLQGSAPLHAGQGPGLTDRFLGESAGEQSVTLIEAEMPAHTHSARVSGRAAVDNDPAGKYWAQASVNAYRTAATTAGFMAPQALSNAGASQPHNNMQPYLTLNFCIALQGIFPPRG